MKRNVSKSIRICRGSEARSHNKQEGTVMRGGELEGEEIWLTRALSDSSEPCLLASEDSWRRNGLPDHNRYKA